MSGATEHWVHYTYKGQNLRMLVKKYGPGMAAHEYFEVRTPRGLRHIRFYGGKWQVVSPIQMNQELLDAVGAGIRAAKLL